MGLKGLGLKWLKSVLSSHSHSTYLSTSINILTGRQTVLNQNIIQYLPKHLPHILVDTSLVTKRRQMLWNFTENCWRWIEEASKSQTVRLKCSLEAEKLAVSQLLTNTDAISGSCNCCSAIFPNRRSATWEPPLMQSSRCHLNVMLS